MIKSNKLIIILLSFFSPVYIYAHGEEVIFLIYGFCNWFILAIILFFVFKIKKRYVFISMSISIVFFILLGFIPMKLVLIHPVSINNYILGLLLPLSISVLSIFIIQKK